MTQLAFVFPGQGSQSVGMLGDLARARPEVQATFAEASAVLGYDLWALTQSGPEADLNRTEVTQPAMLAAGVAVWRAWEAAGGARPAVMTGHSLGEYTALVCAGSLDFRDAVSLVADRGRFMQEAVSPGAGAMAAVIGLDDGHIAEVCAAAAQGEIVSPANFNAPGQVVIAGHAGAVDRALAGAKGAGAKRSIKLAVSVPSHCPLMGPAAERLGERLAEVTLRPPAVRVVHNVDAASHADPDAIRQALVDQLHRSVQWVKTVENLAATGVTAVVEAGPGKVLSGLIKRVERRLTAWPVFDADSLQAALGGVQA
jgi:[acyl-carrier-protein] S-malonyltransferase